MINRKIPHVHQFISEFLGLQKYSKPTDYYKLFCFWKILFFVCCLLILINLSGGLFSYTNGAHEDFLLSFVFWSFQVFGKDLMDYGTRSGKSLSLGIPMSPQDNLSTPKIPSLGMPRKASPLSSTSIGNFTWSYIFIHHMICVLLGASCMIWVFAF